MKAKHNVYGGGSKTNLHGIRFESHIFLGTLIEKNGYRLERVNPLSQNKRSVLYKIYDHQNFLGFYGCQNQIYEALKLHFPNQITNQYIKHVLSKKIYPDAFIINVVTRTLTIFEKKWQQCAGSVDEKIQTAPFKIAMFEKLLRNLPLKINYHYLLSKYFMLAQYRNVKEYYSQNSQVQMFVQGENLDKFNVKKYLQT